MTLGAKGLANMERKITERANGNRRVQQIVTGNSMTEQSHRDECDINKIMAKARYTGVVPSSIHPGHFGDFTGITDFHEAKTRILDAEREFQSLPAKIRKQFANDPGQLLEFMSRPENYDECVELGLFERFEKPAEKESAGASSPDAAGSVKAAGTAESN